MGQKALVILSDLEREILTRIACGDSYAALARRVHLAPSTVAIYSGRIREKLTAPNNAAAVARGLLLGLIVVPQVLAEIGDSLDLLSF